MEGEPEQPIRFILATIADSADVLSTSSLIAYGLIILFLIILSGLISGSENAYFSLSASDISQLNSDDSKSSSFALRLINEPDRWIASRQLLATILILNNFINITIIILSSFVMESLWPVDVTYPFWLTFSVNVILITFILVLFGEVIPKIYATQNNLQLVHLTAAPLFYARKILKPFVWSLTKSTLLIDKKIRKTPDNVSLEELNQAIEIASEDDNIEEKNILKGIVNFGNISVKQIMRPRVDVCSLDLTTEDDELFRQIREWGYSRIPIHRENFDTIEGVLYIKDLLPIIAGKTKRPWQELIRPPFFVPANKKIDDLLEEFQEKRIHMAIVVDEYGGSSGLVTMEDVLEEIFGDLKDEFDEDEIIYSKLDENEYIFEGKILLTDMCRIFDVRSDYFAEVKGEADTLGGMLMEVFKDIPKRGSETTVEEFHFKVESADSRRIKRVKVEYAEQLPSSEEEEHNDQIES
ncbi:MAG: gliding motility-associated protein GldE [Flavobacteriales bacterium]|nr:gliding motility-associated protein GldE [Bacteroidota bacterium]MCB9239952.1 gliding motility-associated protein GldE [Flavobacteriales bacterium]